MNNFLVGFTGLSGVGKDTQAALMQEQYQAVHLKLALPLRAYVYALLELDYTKMMDKEYEYTSVFGKTIQEWLVYQSAEVLKRNLWIWTGCLAERLRHFKDEAVVISDVRQLHEAAFMHQQGGQIVRLYRRNPEDYSRPIQALDQLPIWPLVAYNREIKVSEPPELVNFPIQARGDKPYRNAPLMPFAEPWHDWLEEQPKKYQILELIELQFEQLNPGLK